jgi:Do/DeqQ family serine protease
MNTRVPVSRRVVRAGVAVAAAGLLLSGAAWRAVSLGAAQQARAAAAPAITHAIAGGRDSYADVVNVVAPSVVTIRTSGKARVSPTEFQFPDEDFFRQFFGDQFDSPRRGQRMPQPQTHRQQALGSGVIVSGDGYLLTNNHVVEDADDIKVELNDGRVLSARVVGTDKPSDLAVLKINATNLHAMALGNSDAVQVGDVVLAVGNPLGVGETVTMGIISAKGRSSGMSEGGYEDFLQTDAPINHGNSGGALVNTKGELVGINSQIVSESGGNIGIGFAIPSNMAKTVMNELRTTGRVSRGQLGVTVQTVTSDMAESLGLKDAKGVIVSEVRPGSAADQAGVKRGDVITAFNGVAVHDINSLRNRVAEAGPGKSAELAIIRDGSEKRLTVKLDEASPEKRARNGQLDGESDKSALGVSVTPLTPELADRLGVSKDAHGLVVQDLNADGRAAEAGIQKGDVIEEVNRQSMHTTDDLRAAIRKASDRPMLVLINRQGHQVFMTVKPERG